MVFQRGAEPDLEFFTRREWLVANGIGGYASSTLCGINTRRYHGLLVAALDPPGRRTVLVAKLEDAIECQGWEVPLSSNFYPGTVYPDGYRRLVAVDVRPSRVVFTYDTDNGRLEKSVFMVHGENTTVVTYQWKGEITVPLAIRPLLTCRNFHHLLRVTPDVPARMEVCDNCLVFQWLPDSPMTYIYLAGGTFSPEGHWYHNFHYPREAYRGLDFEEDLFCPGVIVLDLDPERPAEIVLSDRPVAELPVVERWAREQARLQSLRRLWRIEPGSEQVQLLLETADTFLVSRAAGGCSLIAGYHWFGDWGRDVFISLPGIALVTGRIDEAESILRTYAAHESEGMLPNRFSEEEGKPEYNAVDVALWFFVALYKFLQYADAERGLALARDVYPTLVNIVSAYKRGTRHGIGADSDALLCAGDNTTQLTWMDAKVDDHVVTPRGGKPVEVNALWYNALRILAEIERKLGLADGGQWDALAEQVRASFREQFVERNSGALADVLGREGPDFSLRPNQIFAASLPYSLLSEEEARAMLRVVQERLLTPYGLRSLAPGEEGYAGSYGGDVWARDTAYHQGTVWSWLIGPFISACVRHNCCPAPPMDLLAPLLEHTADFGVGSIAEIFDGDEPHEPRGCISQAWSVGEVLRVLFEDVS